VRVVSHIFERRAEVVLNRLRSYLVSCPTSVGARLPDWRDALLVVAAAVAVNLIGAVGVPFTATESAWFAGLDLPYLLPARRVGRSASSGRFCTR